MRILSLASLALLVLVSAARATPEDTTDLARRHFQSGSAYFEEGRFDDAVREFRESYRLAPRAQLLYNIARCFNKKGDAARTIEAYREYLLVNPDAVDRAAIEANLEALRGSVGQVMIANAPPGAEVFVDGYSVGRAPLAGAVSATVGQRIIEARPSDGSALRRVLVMVAAKSEVTATLPEPKRDVVVREVVKEVIKEKVVHVVDTTPRWYTSRPGWVAFTGGAVVAIGGAVLLGLARPTQDEAQRNAKTDAEWQKAQDRAALFQTLGIAFVAGGSALVVVSAVLFAVRGRREPRAATTRFIAPTVNGLVVGGTF